MQRYLDMAEVGAWFGVKGATVSAWRKRYAGTNPCPEPDALIGEQVAGWLPERKAEWEAWEGSRSGQGVGGGRPRRL